MRRLLGCTLVLALAMIGCGGEGAADLSRCEVPDAELVEAIEGVLTVAGGGELRGARAVRSEDFERVWFVAADIQGAGMAGDDEIAVWATNAIDGGTATVFQANALAREFSEMGLLRDDAPEFSSSDDGHAEARACVRAALD